MSETKERRQMGSGLKKKKEKLCRGKGLDKREHRVHISR